MLSLARTWVQFLVRELRSHKPHGEAKTKSLEQVPGVLQSEQDIPHSTPPPPPIWAPSQEFRSWGLKGQKISSSSAAAPIRGNSVLLASLVEGTRIPQNSSSPFIFSTS